MRGGSPVPILDGDGSETIATPVACSSKGEVVVGAEALRTSDAGLLRLVSGELRLLGRRYYSPEIEWLRHSFPFVIVPSPNGDAWIRIGDYDYSPEELVAAVLRHIVARAEPVLGQLGLLSVTPSV